MFSARLCVAAFSMLIAFSGLRTAHAVAAPDAEANADQLLFVPPPVEGLISLGVYDNDGRLVRVLKKAAPVDSFKAASDGLVIDWDKNDANGKPVPPGGKFFARGVMIGDFTIEGIAFHLNDWVDAKNNPRIRKIDAAALLNSTRPAVLAEAAQTEVGLLDSHGNQSRIIPLDFAPVAIKSTGTGLLLFDNAQVTVLDPVASSTPLKQSYPEIRDADATGDRMVVLTGNQIKYLANASSKDLTPPAENLFRCAILSTTVIVATKEANLWRLNGTDFIPIETGTTGQLLDMNAGAQESVWLLVKTTANTLLKQIDASGKLLREIELPPELQAVTKLGAARDSDALLLISENGPEEQVIGIRFQAANEGKSIWQKWFDRSLTNFKYFDLKDGKVVPADSRAESPAVSIKPANNPMENTRQAQFQLSVVADDSGAWVINSDGLPLIQVCTTKNIRQTRTVSDGANGLRIYVSDGSVVEEFRIPKLENLFRFDAGSFD